MPEYTAMDSMWEVRFYWNNMFGGVSKITICKNGNPKVLKVIKDTARKYKEFHKKRSDKDFERSLFFWYKLQEWAYIEFVIKERNGGKFFSSQP